MAAVVVNVYDVTNTRSDKTDNTIMQINKIFKDGVGGVFHRVVDIYGENEWPFGCCEQGTGVFSCPSKKYMYKYHESIVVGETDCSASMVDQILRELSTEWPGCTYHVLVRNCNHFCEELCERLGVAKPPGWVNRFAHVGYAAAEVAANTAVRFNQAKTEIVSASKVAYRFLVGVTNSIASLEPPGKSDRGAPTSQGSWFKKLSTIGTRPSGISEDDGDEDALRLEHQTASDLPQPQPQPSRSLNNDQVSLSWSRYTS